MFSRQQRVAYVGHAMAPAVIFTDGREYVTIIRSEDDGDIFGANPDIEVLRDGQ
jgi:hypothetical protein